MKRKPKPKYHNPYDLPRVSWKGEQPIAWPVEWYREPYVETEETRTLWQ